MRNSRSYLRSSFVVYIVKGPLDRRGSTLDALQRQGGQRFRVVKILLDLMVSVSVLLPEFQTAADKSDEASTFEVNVVQKNVVNQLQ